jgi:ERCC4-related helicase
MLMTGDLAPELRKSHWQTHRAFFMTPQVFENDVSNQICDAKRVSLVVIDEAHKAIGQHSIVKALAYLRDRASRHVIPDGEDSHDRHSNHALACFRVLALTATPGTKADVVQQVITNCFISNLQVRTEQDEDVKGYLLHKDNRQEILKPFRINTFNPSHGPLGFLENFVSS